VRPIRHLIDDLPETRIPSLILLDNPSRHPGSEHRVDEHLNHCKPPAIDRPNFEILPHTFPLNIFMLIRRDVLLEPQLLPDRPFKGENEISNT
jgi:hypothetical protein